MANHPTLAHLPPGWTEDKYQNATDQDFEALTEGVYHQRKVLQFNVSNQTT